MHPEDRPRVWEAHLRAEQTDTPFDEEFRLEASDGRIQEIYLGVG